nr:insulin-like growth factor-binding protein 6 - pig (fragments) [Sus scrofa domesticus]
AQCPGCGQGVQTGCPGGCAEEEDGGEGQQCGVYTPNCAPGLQCQPPEEDQAPLRGAQTLYVPNCDHAGPCWCVD